MNKNKGYGHIISRLRIERGLTQKELAEKMGIPFSLITDYERGKLRLHDEIIVRLAKALETTADVILGLDPTKQVDHSASLRITKRVKRIESLSEFQQKIVLRMIDGYIKGENKD